MNPLDFANLDPDSLRAAARQRLYQEDYELFFRKSLKIQTKDMRIVPFVPNAVQAPIVEKVNRQLRMTGKIRLWIFKCRQPGISTFSCALVGHRTYLFPNVSSFVTAQDKTTVARLFRIFDLFYSQMDPLVKPARQYFTKGTEIVLANPDDSTRFEDPGLMSQLLVGEAKNVHVGTGQTIHCWIGSEISRYLSIESIKDSLIPALSDAPGTIQIQESTAFYAAGGMFFKEGCERAMRNDPDTYHFVEWWRMPEYQVPLLPGEKVKLDSQETYLVKGLGMIPENIKWRRLMIDRLGGDVDSFQQSYPTTFEEGWIIKGSSAFDRARLMELRSMLRPPLRCANIANGEIFSDPNGPLRIWHEPDKNKVYDIGADLAEGLEDGDYTVASVVERYTLKQVAAWVGKKDPYAFAEDLAVLGFFYNGAQIAPEMRPNGYGLINRLTDIYPNIYQWRQRDKIVPKITTSLGWETTNASKNLLVDLARHLIWERKIQIYSEELWEELMNFGRTYTPTGLQTYSAMSGHDDFVMAWLISLRVSEDENYLKYQAIRDTKIENLKGRAVDMGAVNFDKDGLNGPRANKDTEGWD